MLTTGKKESMATDRQNPIAFVRVEAGFWTSIVWAAEASAWTSCDQSFHKCSTCNSQASRKKSPFNISCFPRHKSGCHCLVPILHSLTQVSLQAWDPWQYLGSVCCELNTSCWRLHNFPLPAPLPAHPAGQFSHRRWGFITKTCYSLSQK